MTGLIAQSTMMRPRIVLTIASLLLASACAGGGGSTDILAAPCEVSGLAVSGPIVKTADDEPPPDAKPTVGWWIFDDGETVVFSDEGCIDTAAGSYVLGVGDPPSSAVSEVLGCRFAFGSIFLVAGSSLDDAVGAAPRHLIVYRTGICGDMQEGLIPPWLADFPDGLSLGECRPGIGGDGLDGFVPSNTVRRRSR